MFSNCFDHRGLSRQSTCKQDEHVREHVPRAPGTSHLGPLWPQGSGHVSILHLSPAAARGVCSLGAREGLFLPSTSLSSFCSAWLLSVLGVSCPSQGRGWFWNFWRSSRVEEEEQGQHPLTPRNLPSVSWALSPHQDQWLWRLPGHVWVLESLAGCPRPIEPTVHSLALCSVARPHSLTNGGRIRGGGLFLILFDPLIFFNWHFCFLFFLSCQRARTFTRKTQGESPP